MANVKMDGHTITQLKLVGSDGSTVTKSVSAETNLQSKTVAPTSSEQTVTADSGYDGLSQVVVSATSSEGIVPTGTKEITENGTYDVSAYASAFVNVPTSGGVSNSEHYATGTIEFNGVNALDIDWNLPFTPRAVQIIKTDGIDYTANGCAGYCFSTFGENAFSHHPNAATLKDKCSYHGCLETHSDWATYLGISGTNTITTSVTAEKGSFSPRSAAYPWQAGTYKWEAWA